jgi:glycerol-3-phosphate O-acyltransferase 3/4
LLDEAPEAQKAESVRRAIESNILATFTQENADKTSFALGDVLPFLQQGIESVVQDDFTDSFASKRPPEWNFSAFLFPLWAIGWVIRHFVLFPLRLLILVFASMIVVSITLFFSLVLKKKDSHFLHKLVQLYAQVWLFSFFTILRIHGQPAPRRAGQIFVCNHTSPVDFILFLGLRGCATVGQRHGGFVGFFQKHVLYPLHNIWFERFVSEDRHGVAERMREHAADASLPPLLLFPEGVCVNNEYCVMFRKGAFELGVEIMPVAVKYDKAWADPYWNSKEESFPWHIFRLMTGWCFFVDFTYLPPTSLQPGENAADFAERVRAEIAEAAGLTPVSWDGYYKYYQPTAKFLEARQKAFADVLLRRMSPVSSLENLREKMNGAEAETMQAVKSRSVPRKRHV